MCPVCKSRCRTRLVWCFLDKDKTLFDESQTKRLLHIAPEPCFEKRFKEMPEIDYLSGDINASKAMEQIDIMNISYPDNYFDVLFCSHVLEHVIDDRKAVREFYRVLKLNGVAMIMVPINRPQSVEDPAITDPNEQKRLYGTRGHVRAYGPDFVNRLSEAGFEVTKVRPQDVLDDKEAIRQGVRGGPLFLCRK
jgi:SAM-dependent methyltransferase